jgi:transcriptional regulator with XRE-family HTH domain
MKKAAKRSQKSDRINLKSTMMKLQSINAGGFATTRARLGLSQQQLADHLGISKTAVGMAEIGRRHLPTAALLKLAELEIKIAAAQLPGKLVIEKEAATPQQIQASYQSIGLRELQCELQIQKYVYKLQYMTAMYQQYQMQLHSLKDILNKAADPVNNLFILSLQLHRDRVAKQLAKYNLAEQALLRNKIALLSAETCLSKSVRQRMI